MVEFLLQESEDPLTLNTWSVLVHTSILLRCYPCVIALGLPLEEALNPH